MRIPILLGAAALAVLATSTSVAAPRPPIATFSADDAQRVFAAGCGVGARGAVRVKRAAAGNMLTCVGERQSESILYPTTVACNPISEDCLDIWRTEKGTVAAQLIDRSDGARLLVGRDAEIRGKRFDVDRTGQYLVTSHGTDSTLSSVARPYLKILDLASFDAQRIFVRRGSILLIGDNATAGRLEARIVRIAPEGLTEDPNPVPVAGMPVGVKVLDYAEESDDLLLGGVDEAGQASFVLVNLGSGQTSSVKPQKPGDNRALFISEAAVRERLTGTRDAAAGSPTSSGGAARKGWFSFGRKKSE